LRAVDLDLPSNHRYRRVGMHERTSPAADGRIVPITFALGLGAFLTLFDVTAVVVAMPGIAKDLGFDVAGAAWVIDAYSLAFTGALLASGALADRFGRRRSMLIGNAVFLVASIACGLATDGPTLLASRLVQGVGAAFMVTGATALIAPPLAVAQILMLVPGVGLTLGGAMVARTYRSANERLQVALEQVLDRLERGDTRPAGQAALPFVRIAEEVRKVFDNPKPKPRS